MGRPARVRQASVRGLNNASAAGAMERTHSLFVYLWRSGPLTDSQTDRPILQRKRREEKRHTDTEGKKVDILHEEERRREAKESKHF